MLETVFDIINIFVRFIIFQKHKVELYNIFLVISYHLFVNDRRYVYFKDHILHYFTFQICFQIHWFKNDKREKERNEDRIKRKISDTN